MKVIRGIFTALMTMYSVFVFFTLSFSTISLKAVAEGMLIIGLINFFLNINTSSRWTPVFVCVIAVGMLCADAELVFRFYPIGVVLVFLWVFGSSLLRKDPIVYHFALLMDRSIKTHPGRVELESYCKRVTEVWVLWFIINLLIDFYFVFFGSLEKWAIFNGPVCWSVQALIFTGEFIVRYFVISRVDAKYNMPHRGFFDVFRTIRNSRKAEEETAK